MIANRWKDVPWLVLLAAAVYLAAPGSAGARAGDEFVPNQLVCRTLTPEVIDTIDNQYGTSVLSYLPLGHSYLLQTQPGTDVEALAAELSLWPNVAYCEPNYLLDAPEPVQSSQPFLDENRTGSLEEQPAALTLNLAAAQTTSTGQTVGVAVIDAGVTMTHPAFDGAVVSGFDYVDMDTSAIDPGGTAAGHGTFVAGVVTLVAPEANVRSYRVIDTSGSGAGYTVAEAVLQAVQDGCRVINLSLVMNTKHSTLDEAIEYAHHQGVLVVAAAGNDSSEVERFPAIDSYVLGVAGLDSLNHKADFSNFNGKLDVCAPATRIYAPFADTSYAWWDGTSFGTPFVAGLAALLWEIYPDATVGDIIEAITQTAIDVDANNLAYAGNLGAGLIDPVAAIDFIQSLAPVCGDLTGDGGESDIADLTYMVSFLFKGGPAPVNLAMANVDGAGDVTVADLSYLVGFLFKGGAPPICTP